MHKFDYQYGGNQNRTQETEFNGIDTLVTDFDYDQQDRLTTAIYAGDSQLQNNGIATYTYDDNSNRETETFTTAANVLSKNITYGYDNNDQLTSIVDSVESANTVVDYDTLGNLTKKSKTQNNTTAITDYIYDARNQLKQVQMGGSTIGAFLYDANGLRVHKTETLTDANTQIASTTQQRYHYQGLNVIGSFDEQNQSQYRYYHDGNQILARINESAFTDINVENNAVQTYHQDALGSTAVISNRDGSLTARYQYDAFGNVQTETGQFDSNDFTYTGHERDQASGLIYAKARYYDPQLGLFLSRDPFEGYDNTPLSLQRYLYAYQNPMKYVDPDGREPVTLTAMVAYMGWASVNTAFDTTVDYGFHKLMGEGDFKFKETVAVNFGINMATAGVGNKVKHANKAAQLAAKVGTNFTGQYAQAKYVEGLSTDEALVSAAVGTVAGEAFERSARAGYKGLKNKFGKQLSSATKYVSNAYNGATGLVKEMKTKLGVGVSGTAHLPYDVSNWKKYGLPSDGTFSRSLRPSEAQDFIEGRSFVFGGRPVEAYGTKDGFIDPGYPEGQGFVGRSEDSAGITSKEDYRDLYKLEPDQIPEYVLDFQIKDPSKLQNVLYAPYELFERGGKTGSGLPEYNYPGINSDDLLNPILRSLE
jgi:RHS repeat-associated protein